MAAPKKKATSKDASAAAAGNAEVQEAVDVETEQGYRGTSPDPTPNENYTLQGVVSGAPTPETSVDQAREVADLALAARLNADESTTPKA